MRFRAVYYINPQVSFFCSHTFSDRQGVLLPSIHSAVRTERIRMRFVTEREDVRFHYMRPPFSAFLQALVLTALLGNHDRFIAACPITSADLRKAVPPNVRCCNYVTVARRMAVDIVVFFGSQDFCDFSCSRAVNGKVENPFNDPFRFIINGKRIFDLRVTDIAEKYIPIIRSFKFYPFISASSAV